MAKTSNDSKVNNKERVNKKIYLYIIILLLVIATMAIFILKFKPAKIEKVNDISELNEKLDFDITNPDDAVDAVYEIENDKIARITYDKKISDEKQMKFILKSSSSREDNLSGLHNRWGTPILMTVICNDGSDIQVESYVAINNNKIMKSEWFDNDLYYSMTTENLTTREDFLQEVNKLILKNHIEF